MRIYNFKMRKIPLLRLWNLHITGMPVMTVLTAIMRAVQIAIILVTIIVIVIFSK